MLVLTAYMLIWSPLYVHHPRASSDKSPVPTTKPPSLFATSIRICVRSLAWQFSYVTSCTCSSCPISRKCCRTESAILISLTVQPRYSISATELFFVRSVVPNPGIVIPVTVSGESPRSLTACAHTSSASVESSPPDTPTTTHLLFVASMRLASAVTCI